VLGCCNEAAVASPASTALSDNVQVDAAAAAHEAAVTAEAVDKSPTEQAQAAAAAASEVATEGGASVALAAGLGAGAAGGAAGLSPEDAAAAISAQDSATDSVVAAAAAASAAGTAAGLTDQQADDAATQVGTAAGETAGLTTDAAAETAAQAATMANQAKDAIGATVSEASAPAAAAPAPPPAPTGMLQNNGLDCWEPCNQKTGLCDYCGRGNACCNRNSANPPTECKNITTFVTWHHECVTPVQQVDKPAEEAFEDPTAAGATAASEAASAGKSTEEQTAAAAVAAGQSATKEGMPLFQATQASTEAAKDAASSAGLDGDAAQTAGSAAASAAAASGFSDDMLVATSAGNNVAMDVQTGTETAAADTKTITPSDAFGTGQWVLVILAVLAILAAGAAGYYLSGQGQREVKTFRDAEVALPAPASKDLEYQAPLVTAAAAPVMYQQVATLPARQVAGQGVMGTRFAFSAMDAFDAADTNHNSVLSRAEFNAGIAHGIIR